MVAGDSSVTVETMKWNDMELRFVRQPDGKKRWLCDLCPGKVLASKTGLIFHIRAHKGEKPFACSNCGRRFTQKGNMKVHKRSCDRVTNPAVQGLKASQNAGSSARKRKRGKSNEIKESLINAEKRKKKWEDLGVEVIESHLAMYTSAWTYSLKQTL